MHQLSQLPDALPDTAVRLGAAQEAGMTYRTGLMVYDEALVGGRFVGRLARATLVADRGGPCRVSYGQEALILARPEEVVVISRPGDDVLHFMARGGQPVILRPAGPASALEV